MHEAEQANLNLGCLDQFEALTVKKTSEQTGCQKKNMRRPIYTCQEGTFCQLQVLTGELISGKLKCGESPPAQEILDGKCQRIQ